MKFLLVSPFTSISGSAIRFHNIAKQLIRFGHTVVYIERTPIAKQPPVLPGIRYHTTMKRSNLYLDIIISTIYNLVILFKNLDCDIYYALKPAPNNCFGACIAKLLGKRIFLDIDDLDFGYFPEGMNRRLSQFFFHFFPRFFELITCHTVALQQYCVAKLNIDPCKIYFLQQGISEVYYSFLLPARVNQSPKSIVYAATLGITSDFVDLLPLLASLCKKHSDLRINIVGDGVRKSDFERRIKELGISGNVFFWGRTTHEEMPRLLADNWIGINYMRKTETNDCRAILKLREYLACGLQVVCNETGDADVFSRHVFIESTLEGMENRISELLNKGKTYNEAGNKFILDNFNWETIIRNFLSHAHIPADFSRS
jgi:glycosyltransferase involved in cell wall biosynthesis